MTPSHLSSGPELDPVKGVGAPPNGLLDLCLGHEFTTANHFTEIRVSPDQERP